MLKKKEQQKFEFFANALKTNKSLTKFNEF